MEITDFRSDDAQNSLLWSCLWCRWTAMMLLMAHDCSVFLKSLPYLRGFVFFYVFPLLQANTWPCHYVPVSMVPPTQCYPLYIHSLPYIFYSIYETYHKITGGSPWNAAMILQKGTFTRIQTHQPFAHLSARISSRNHALTWNLRRCSVKNTSPKRKGFIDFWNSLLISFKFISCVFDDKGFIWCFLFKRWFCLVPWFMDQWDLNLCIWAPLGPSIHCIWLLQPDKKPKRNQRTAFSGYPISVWFVLYKRW